LLRADGTNERTVIGSDPRFSNDGTSLAFYGLGRPWAKRPWPVPTVKRSACCRCPIDLTVFARTAFAVSPGGAYVARVFTSAYTLETRFGSKQSPMGRCGNDEQLPALRCNPPLVWSPDGRRLAVSVTLSPLCPTCRTSPALIPTRSARTPRHIGRDSVFGGAAPGFVEQGWRPLWATQTRRSRGSLKAPQSPSRATRKQSRSRSRRTTANTCRLPTYRQTSMSSDFQTALIQHHPVGRA
jgi:hypothetical protein